MSFIRIFLILITFLFIPTVYSCEDWFKSLKINVHKTCESKCRTAQTDMATYLCPQQCDILCKNLGKPLKKDPNFYGLTDDEISFCKNNKLICIKAYDLSWDAEKICKELYIYSELNDESDACRHYVWAFLLSKEIDLKTAETLLNAHENNPLEPKDQQQMDLANNKLGQDDFKKNKNLDNKDIIDLFKKNLKAKKLIILNPKYQKSGGLP
jgi:hypothetical protein